MRLHIILRDIGRMARAVYEIAKNETRKVTPWSK